MRFQVESVCRVFDVSCLQKGCVEKCPKLWSGGSSLIITGYDITGEARPPSVADKWSMWSDLPRQTHVNIPLSGQQLHLAASDLPPFPATLRKTRIMPKHCDVLG